MSATFTRLEKRIAALKREVLLMQQYMPKPEEETAAKRLSEADRLIALEFLAAIRKGWAEGVWARQNPEKYQRLLAFAPKREVRGPDGRPAPQQQRERKRKRREREGAPPVPGGTGDADSE